MKAIRCDLPYAEKIEIHPMADLHLGDNNSDFKLIMERIEYIKNTPNAYCILGGDLMDAAIASSIGDTLLKSSVVFSSFIFLLFSFISISLLPL